MGVMERASASTVESPSTGSAALCRTGYRDSTLLDRLASSHGRARRSNERCRQGWVPVTDKTRNVADSDVVPLIRSDLTVTRDCNGISTRRTSDVNQSCTSDIYRDWNGLRCPERLAPRHGLLPPTWATSWQGIHGQHSVCPDFQI